MLIDTTWDFRQDNTKEYTHCFHPYPAMMIPQVARRILKEFGSEAKLLFDPYCGTGTSLVEENLQNVDSIGIDINPLACLLARAKTTPIGTQTLNLHLKDFNSYVFQYKIGARDYSSIILPKFKNIDFWFSQTVLEKLTTLKKYIDKIEDEAVKNFFIVAFSETVRECSWTKNSEFKLVRMKEDEMRRFDPDVFDTMESKLIRNRQGLLEYLRAKHNGAKADVYTLNTVLDIPNDILQDHSADIVITSPPYGDSRTTVAYGQFSRLSSQWLSFQDANKLDNQMMGGKKISEIVNTKSAELQKTIGKINQIDSERCKDVISFFNDYKKSIDNVSRKIRRGGYACYVVGNRTVKGVQIPTSEITKDFFRENGFRHIKTVIRNIPNKRMPSENSPSNIKGVKSPTIKNEYIVICQKENK